jgi:hypothetical protein
MLNAILYFIPVKGGELAIVDRDIWHKAQMSKWSLAGKGYPHAKIKGKQVYLHRLVLAAVKGEEVDHINHNILDCRRQNLRICTRSQNFMNRRPYQRQLPKGVSESKDQKRIKKFRARIMKDNKEYFIGRFATIKEAAAAYHQKAKELFGEFAYTED